jgi:bacteriophage N4 adsorption protein B
MINLAITLLIVTQRELLLFAAVGFLIIGFDDLVIDVMWLMRAAWRRVTVYRRNPRTTTASLPKAKESGWLAVFIPAWDEADVIGDMLRYTIQQWYRQNITLYVGCYRNDPGTIAQVRSFHLSPIRIVIVDADGPTTKADCLNALWAALVADEQLLNARAKAVILHDAEDMVHPFEPQIFDAMIERFALVQLPVLPLVDPNSRWISGHYIDEFAEAHAKDMVIREAIGASLPSAGVGCAIERNMLQSIADAQSGLPFDAASLTEDYELGLKIHRMGGRGALIRIPTPNGKEVVAVHAHFPPTLDTAVRQKSRWILGIALAGWDRTGWQGGLFETWMRVRDRRSTFSALILVAGYACIVLTALMWFIGIPTGVATEYAHWLLSANAMLLLWRIGVRVSFVNHHYGPVEALLAAPRMVTGNLIAVMAARRAVMQYVRLLRTGEVRWDKTSHQFPTVGR